MSVTRPAPYLKWRPASEYPNDRSWVLVYRTGYALKEAHRAFGMDRACPEEYNGNWHKTRPGERVLRFCDILELAESVGTYVTLERIARGEQR